MLTNRPPLAPPGHDRADDDTLVLVVDDSPDTLTMLTDALTFEGMQVTIAESGRRALAMAADLMPDIILMDARMPGMDGFETCQVLKAEPQFADIPVIFMTGLNDSEHVVRALASGGVDFISKPAALPELVARMRVHLTNARKARSAREALDTTGRRIVSTDNDGMIGWATPQAGELLARVGIGVEAGARLPWEVMAWLGDLPDPDLQTTTAPVEVNRNGMHLEFRLVGGNRDTGWLLRIVDRNRGTDEERLAFAFDLSLREAEVLLWTTHGKSNKEIAEILDLSPRTVNKHLEQIFDKLGVENRTAAATKSVRVLWD